MSQNETRSKRNVQHFWLHSVIFFTKFEQYNKAFQSLFSMIITEAVARRCSLENVFLEIPQNSEESTCSSATLLEKRFWFSCEFCKISKNTFFYRTPPVTASVISIWELFFPSVIRLLLANFYIYNKIPLFHLAETSLLTIRTYYPYIWKEKLVSP